MEINKPDLFIEINNSELIFYAIKLKEDFELKIISFNKIKLDKISGSLNFLNSYGLIKEKISLLENAANHTFRKVNLIYKTDKLKCINISGFKKLAGSQVLEEDIEFIINNLKQNVIENNPNLDLVHIFNSKFYIDKEEKENLPVGLYGEFYNHHLSFFLIPKTDLKNLKLMFNKCSLEINKIILKPFVEGAVKIKNNPKENNFFRIIIEKNKSYIFCFQNSALIFVENFNFGSDIIKRDFSKLCSIKDDQIDKILNELDFNTIIGNKDYLDKKFFNGKPFRKISVSHINDIFFARINEIIGLIYKKNLNLKYLSEGKKLIYLCLDDPVIYKNLKENFKKSFSTNDKINFEITQDEHDQSFLTSAELTYKGWEKEAIPIIQTKKTVFSKIFSAFFK